MSPHCDKAGLDLSTTEELIVLVVVVIELNEQFLAVHHLMSIYLLKAQTGAVEK